MAGLHCRQGGFDAGDDATAARWQGHWNESAALFLRAADLDPLGVAPVFAITTLKFLGRREEVLALAAKARRNQPHAGYYAVVPAVIAGNFDCALGRAQALLTDLPPALDDDLDVVEARWFNALQRGDFTGALAILDRLPPVRRDDTFGWRRALVLRAAGQSSEWHELLRAEIARWRAELPHMPTDADRASKLSWLAFGYGLLGDRRQAERLLVRPDAGTAAGHPAVSRDGGRCRSEHLDRPARSCDLASLRGRLSRRWHPRARRQRRPLENSAAIPI